MMPPIWQSEVQVRLAMSLVFFQLGTQLICYICGFGGHKKNVTEFFPKVQPGKIRPIMRGSKG